MINICIIATIVIYLVGMLLVGFVYSKSNEDSSDFYLGGRTMGPLVTAMSAEASDMSSWLLMGMPGLAYLTGIASPGWTAIGLAVGTWLNWLIVARRLRRYSANLDAITVPQFLSLRFHDQRNLLNALGAVIIIVFFIPYTASGFAACGKLFNSLFGVDYMAAMVLSAVVIVGWIVLFKTRFGLRLRMVGENPKAAATMGLRVHGIKYCGVLICGALAGVGGAYLSLDQLDMFVRNMTAGRGYIAVAIAILGRYNPAQIVPCALLFGFCDAVQIYLQGEAFPPQIVQMLPYIVTLLVLAFGVKHIKPPAGVGKYDDE